MPVLRTPHRWAPDAGTDQFAILTEVHDLGDGEYLAVEENGDEWIWDHEPYVSDLRGVIDKERMTEKYLADALF